MSAATARRHLERLAAQPRPAGSESEAEARRYCSDTLEALGFTVRTEPFEYSAAPGRWATSLGGIASIVAIGAAGHVGSRGAASSALAILATAIMLGAPLALWTARHGVTALPLARRRGLNLVATRGEAVPGVWLVAHLDSKSQPVPTAVRALGIVASVVVWVVAIVTSVLQLRGYAVAAWWPAIAVAGLLAGLPVAASIVGNRSPGALDNASGVATVLLAAERMQGGAVGVLLTSAEELGLAGARAWGRSQRPAIALNCDGVDDVGRLVCMRARGGGASRAVEAIVAGARESGLTVDVRGLIPGLLVDSVALSDAGWDAATLSRGVWRTLARVHRPGDDLQHLAGTGIEDASRVMAAAARIARGPTTPT